MAGAARIVDVERLFVAVDRGMPLVDDSGDTPIRGVDDVGEALHAMLGGIGLRHAEALLGRVSPQWKTIPDENYVAMDRLAASLLSHHGIDPLVMHAFGVALAGEVTVAAAGGGHHVYKPGLPPWTVTVALSPSVTWTSTGALLVDQLPLTVAHTLAGTRLDRVLSHALLDPLQLVIREAAVSNRGIARLDLDYDGEQKRATLEDLIAAGPNGCR